VLSRSDPVSRTGAVVVGALVAAPRAAEDQGTGWWLDPGLDPGAAEAAAHVAGAGVEVSAEFARAAAAGAAHLPDATAGAFEAAAGLLDGAGAEAEGAFTLELLLRALDGV
jgi:hypothetical protein